MMQAQAGRKKKKNSEYTINDLKSELSGLKMLLFAHIALSHDITI